MPKLKEQDEFTEAPGFCDDRTLAFNRALVAEVRRSDREADEIVERGEVTDHEEALELMMIKLCQRTGMPYKANFLAIFPRNRNFLDKMLARKNPVSVMKTYGGNWDVRQPGFPWKTLKTLDGKKSAMAYIEKIRQATDVVLGSPDGSEEV